MSMYKTICITSRHLVTGDYNTQIKKALSRRPYALILREKDLTEKDYEYVAKDVIKLYNDGNGQFSGLPASSDFLIGLCRNWAGAGAIMYLMCPPGYTFPANSSLTLQARLVVSLYSD